MIGISDKVDQKNNIFKNHLDRSVIIQYLINALSKDSN